MTVLYILWYTLPPYFGKKNLAQRFRDVLNGDGKGKNGELVMRKEGVRYYAFSKADKSIDERDVLAHAAQAKERGWRVCTESWENAEHVGLMRVEPERYWKIVEKAWAERG